MITTQDPFKQQQQKFGPPRRLFSDELHARAWPAFLARKGRRRALFAALVFLALFVDYGTGPTIRFPALYAIPILLVAWYEGFWQGLGTSGGIIAARLWMEGSLWDKVPWAFSDSLINAATALCFMAVVSWFTALAGRLSREVQLLGGLLPVCASCHRFHDEHGEWREFEEYIMERSQALVSHTLCPACLKKAR